MNIYYIYATLLYDCIAQVVDAGFSVQNNRMQSWVTYVNFMLGEVILVQVFAVVL
jgi:hypothetical protein